MALLNIISAAPTHSPINCGKTSKRVFTVSLLVIK